MKRGAYVLSLLIAGCAVGPDYHRPSIDTPPTYRDVAPTHNASGNDTNSVGDSDWWAIYRDPNLQALLERALRNNYDVKIAVARIEQAQAQLGSTRLYYLPQVSAEAGVAKTQTSDYARLPSTARINSEDQIQIQASYQLDIWGQLRRMNAAARANLLASEYAQRAVRVTLVATLAADYFTLVSLDSQLEIAHRTVGTRDKFVELTTAQHKGGYVTGLDVANAEAQLASARAVVPDLERQIAQTEDEISILLGDNPAAIVRTHYGESVPEAPPRPPPGLPAQLLERRPDIQQAEQQLIAANAQIGVAKAALFPNISLTGSDGQLSPSLGQLFTSPAAEWSVGVNLLQPLLSVQQNLYQVQLADARKREALFFYQKTVQEALRDVADALVAYEKYGEFETEDALQVDALRRARAIAMARYRTGYASYFDVINADRDLFAAELLLAQAYGNNLDALVRLYSALGGGWQQRTVGPERSSDGMPQ